MLLPGRPRAIDHVALREVFSPSKKAQSEENSSALEAKVPGVFEGAICSHALERAGTTEEA